MGKTNRLLIGSIAGIFLFFASFLLYAQTDIQLDLSYSETLRKYGESGYKDSIGVNIDISPLDYFNATPGAAKAEAGIGGAAESVLVWNTEDTWIEYKVDIPESGLYNMEIEYYPLPGRRGAIQRELLIDGEHPFREAKTIVLPRIWKDAHEPKTDNQGHQVRPRQIESPMWKTVSLEDYKGEAKEPLAFFLSKGEHTIRFISLKEPVAIRSLRIHSPPNIPAYAELKAEYDRLNYATVPEALIKIQAEKAAYKSEPTVRMEHTHGLRAEPRAITNRIFNVFGYWRWRNGNQFAAWNFRVDTPGLYKISMSILQNFNEGLPSVRRVQIDGKIPFQEMAEVILPYDKWWQPYTFGGEEDPYLIYLDEGEHTLTLTVKVGPVRTVVSTIEESVRDISRMQREIIKITGVEPDRNREWDNLTALVPGMVPLFERIADELDTQRILLLDLSQGRRKFPVANVLAMASEQFRSFAAKPQSVPFRLNELSATLSGMVSWLIDIKEQPLAIDWIAFADPEVKLPRVKENIFERIAAGLTSLWISFQRDATGIGNIYGGEEEDVALTVWVARGREWAEMIKEMIDDSFTPETGIKVNLNILPAGETKAILLNAIAGRAPDVAMAMDPILPVDFGIRGALVNLNQFSDYEEVTTRFRPGALVPFRFRGEDFALPERQNFSMLFYRTDILNELEVEVPQSWDDLYEILPVLQRNGMDFYYAGVAAIAGQVHAGILPFLLQRGGRFYTEDQLSALDEPEALAAFKQWTELYTNWKVPIKANFYNRMRTGEMPIGISDYLTYMQLNIAAPELKGWWEMSPIPGTLKEDGTIDRSAGGAGESIVIFEQSQHQEEAWQFLKWWTSTESQIRYGEEIEAYMGVEARWNTSNVEALKSLPWPNKDINAILEQWEWFREQPVVLGGYFTSRHVQNAWNRVVLKGVNPREALELAYEDIDWELRRKQREFGFTPTEKIDKKLTPEIQQLLDEVEL